MNAVGFAMLEQPLRGRWTFNGFPPSVVLFGRTFKRAKWAAPRRFVAAQYREDIDHHAMHLMVGADGNWIIEHTDDANPDRGLLLEHTLRDVIRTPAGAFALLGTVLLVTAGISYALTR